jgi:two-component sensor histidine kinase
MHPILASSRRLLWYLLTWVPLGALLALLTHAEAAAIAPACLLYAFVCLSPWYICRAIPLRLSNINNAVLTFAAASSAGGLMLLGTAAGASALLDKMPPQAGALFGAGALLYLLSAGLHYAGLAAESTRISERREAEARTLAREAELQALRTQINPHFLFNSLHSISALATQDGARAREMCLRLAEFLRASLKLGARESIPLAEEVALARSYLDVERVRFGDRLRVEAEIDTACEACQIPALLLQPLVENAVKHGIANLVDGGTIRLNARLSGVHVSITLENEFDPDTVSSGRSLGLGLAQVRKRLAIRYGDDALFEAGPRGEVFRVAMRFACKE